MFGCICNFLFSFFSFYIYKFKNPANHIYKRLINYLKGRKIEIIKLTIKQPGKSLGVVDGANVLLSALAPRVRPTIVAGADSRTAHRLASWSTRESRTPVATRFWRSSASPSVAVRLPSSCALLARATFRAAFHRANGAALARGETVEPSRAEPSRVESSRAGTEREERAHASHCQWYLACASPCVGVCHECVHRAIVPDFTLLRQKFFPSFLSSIVLPRSVSNTLDSSEDRAIPTAELFISDDNVIRCVVVFVKEYRKSVDVEVLRKNSVPLLDTRAFPRTEISSFSLLHGDDYDKLW